MAVSLVYAAVVVVVLLALFAYFYVTRETVTYQSRFDASACQVFEFAPAQRPNETPVYRNVRVKTTGLVQRQYPDATTLYENFYRGVRLFPDNACWGVRPLVAGKAGPFTFTTYKEAWAKCTDFGAGMRALGVKPSDAVGIYSINRPEWVEAEQACFQHSLVTVPVYDTLGDDAVDYIADSVNMRVLVCSKSVLARALRCAAQTKSLSLIVCMDADFAVAGSVPSGVKVLSMAEVEALGAKTPCAMVPPTPDAIATIMYTSGTTGMPKGAMLTHANIISEVAGVAIQIQPTDSYLSYLPLAHVFERLMHVVLYAHGARVGFFQGSVPLLLDDVATLKPTIFAAVPRVYNRVFDKVMAVIKASPIKHALFKCGMRSKLHAMRRGQRVRNIWDKIMFDKIRARLGGKVRLMVTGSAPISAEVMTFLRVCFGADVLEGYGQTETSAAVTLTAFGDFSTGHVGAPLLNCDIKLVSVEEMNYSVTSNPPKGEICSRGYNTFKGYFKDQQNTADTIDADGWLHSGDIGQMNANGTITIIDRKKNIFKLSQGEYIAPEKIEQALQRSSYVEQIFVYGDSLQSVLVAIVVPDREALLAYAKANSLRGDLPTLVQNDRVKALIMKDLNDQADVAGLKGFERIRAVHLEASPFSVENDLLTPSFKLKRPQLRDHYRAIIDRLYATEASVPFQK